MHNEGDREERQLMDFDQPVTAKHLSRHYKEVVALNDVSMDVHPEEVVVIVGPNGSGKTTLVETLIGLRKVERGQVHIFGVEPRSNRRLISPHLAVTLQGAAIHGQTTTQEFIQYMAALYGKTQETVKGVLDQLHVNQFYRKRFGALSGGQQRRVLVAGALITTPKLLVLDEPTSGVDIESRMQLWAAVRSCSAEHGTAVLTTTHDLNEAETYGDRILVMRNGQIVDTGKSREIIERTGIQTVLSITFDANSPALPEHLGHTVLREEFGYLLLACPNQPVLNQVNDWLSTQSTVRAVDTRPPSLADAYLWIAHQDPMGEQTNPSLAMEED